jgi:hypothetical protein
LRLSIARGWIPHMLLVILVARGCFGGRFCYVLLMRVCRRSEKGSKSPATYIYIYIYEKTYTLRQRYAFISSHLFCSMSRHIHIYIRICIYIYIYISIYISIYICIHVYIHGYKYIHVCIYIYIYIYMYTYIYIYVCVCKMHLLIYFCHSGRSCGRFRCFVIQVKRKGWLPQLRAQVEPVWAPRKART